MWNERKQQRCLHLCHLDKRELKMKVLQEDYFLGAQNQQDSITWNNVIFWWYKQHNWVLKNGKSVVIIYCLMRPQTRVYVLIYFFWWFNLFFYSITIRLTLYENNINKIMLLRAHVMCICIEISLYTTDCATNWLWVHTVWGLIIYSICSIKWIFNVW